MKSTKQIADDIGLDKQRVYRYIKRNNITEAYQEAGVMYYDEAAETLIKSSLSKNITSDDVNQTVSEPLQSTITETLVDLLRLELEAKNRLISEQQQTIDSLTSTISSFTSIVATKDNQILELTASLNAAQALHAGTIQRQLTENRQQGEDIESTAEAAQQKHKWWMFWK